MVSPALSVMPAHSQGQSYSARSIVVNTFPYISRTPPVDPHKHYILQPEYFPHFFQPGVRPANRQPTNQQKTDECQTLITDLYHT